MFNVLGALIFLPIYEFGHYFINYPFAEATNPFGIAVCHSIFNIATTVLLFPFAKQMEKLAYVLIKDKKDEKVEDEQQEDGVSSTKGGTTIGDIAMIKKR